MRHRLNPILSLLVVPVLCAPLLAQMPCTQQTVVGTYAFLQQGNTLVTLPGAVQPVALPFAALAAVSIDSAGAISGEGYGALAGQVAQASANGSIQVNPDCTASSTPENGIVDTNVILDGGNEIRGLMLQSPVGKPVIQGVGKRISRAPGIVRPRRCSLAKVHGTYGITHQGIYMTPQPGTSQPIPVPALILGEVSIDSQGGLMGGGTISLAGTAMKYEIVRGQIQSDSDCTAIVQLSVKSGALADEGKAWMVVLEGGDELWLIQTESQRVGPVVTGIWKRMSPGAESAAE
jgi:hypothetical protein